MNGREGPGRAWVALLPAAALLPFGLDYLTGTPSAVRTAWLLALGAVGVLLAWRVVRAPREPEAGDARGGMVPLLGLVAAYAAAGVALALSQYTAFGEPLGQDTAYFTQVLWSAAHGEGFRGPVLNQMLYSPPIESHFGAHNSPFLFLLVPLAWLFPGAPALLVARTLALAATAIPAFALFRRHLPRPAAWLATAALLAHPAFLAGAFHSLYELPFALPFLAAALLALDRGSAGWYALALLAATAVREDIAFAAAMIGIVAILRGGRWGWGVPTVLAAAVWFLATYTIVLPRFGAASGSVMTGLFSRFGSTPVEILLGMLRDPGAVAAEILGPQDRIYLLDMLRATGGLAFAGVASLMAAPGLFFNTLLSWTKFGTLNLAYHHSLVPAFGLALGGGEGIATLSRPLGRAAGSRGRAAVVLGIAALTASLAGALDVISPDTLARLRPGTEAPAIRAALVLIPGDASVAAPRGVLAHLATRRELYEIDEIVRYTPEPRPEWVLLDDDLDRARVFREYRASFLEYRRRVLEAGDYETAFERDGIRLLRRRAPAPELPQ